LKRGEKMGKLLLVIICICTVPVQRYWFRVEAFDALNIAPQEGVKCLKELTPGA
jgi:hypothetical protein